MEWPPTSHRWMAGLVIAAGLGAALPALPALAQHPLPAAGRPLHRRIPLADLVAVVRVESVTAGRLGVIRRAVLLGHAPARFEIKRSPSRPPPLEVGDLAFVLLRGARSPFVPVDEPDETIRIPPGDEPRWAEALTRAVAEPTSPRVLAPLYLAWIDEGPGMLREAAFQGLLDPLIDTEETRAAVALDRARAAADPGRAPAARRASAVLAIRTPEGTAALLPSVARGDAEASVVAAALRGGSAHRSPGTRRALERALTHSEPSVRRAALQALPLVAGAFGEAPLERLKSIAASDPDAAVRRRAERMLATLGEANRGH